MSGDNRLFVEGKLDAELLNPLGISGWEVTALKDGGKYALKPRTREERLDKPKFKAYYLRDRDFDFDPASDAGVGPYEVGDNLGFRWGRHEIENYMIDPLIIRAILELDNEGLENFREALVDAGNRICHYQAGRWAVGIVRCNLPYPRELQTHPREIDPENYALPENLEREPIMEWALEHTETYRNQVNGCLATISVEQAFVERANFFQIGGFMAVENILVWFSGKDLLSALRDWLLEKGQGEPGYFLSKIRDWMIRNAATVKGLLPEWNQLVITLDEISRNP